MSLDYKCPVCGVQDRYTYLVCNHPACPDGRDQVRPRSDNVSFERDPRPPLHRMSLFAAARRERRHKHIGQLLLAAAYIAVGIAFILIAKGP